MRSLAASNRMTPALEQDSDGFHGTCRTKKIKSTGIFQNHMIYSNYFGVSLFHVIELFWVIIILGYVGIFW
jgi:hypothetical protein